LGVEGQGVVSEGCEWAERVRRRPETKVEPDCRAHLVRRWCSGPGERNGGGSGSAVRDSAKTLSVGCRGWW
jgi:hypothetical protein